MDEIRALSEQGESFAEKFPEEQKRIYEQVKGLRELSKIDLSKVANPVFQIGNFGDNFIPGAILWVILVVPLIMFISGVSGAIQGFKERLPLAGLLRIVLALTGGGLLGFVLWPDATKIIPTAENTEIHSSAQRGLWLSRNLIEQWADQPSQKVNVPSEAWLGFISGTLQPGTEDLSSLFWCLQKPIIKRENKQLLVVQPLVLKILPINLIFVFLEPSKGQSWTEVDLTSFKIGHLPLGKLVGSYALQALSVAYEGVRTGFALDKGVRWAMDSDDMLVVEIPSARQKRPVAKDSLSAKELAEVFDQGFGDIYEGKVISVEGDLIDVSSQKESMGAGTNLAVQDRMDEFILEGVKEGRSRRYALNVRCQFKSTEAYFLDAKGDLFNSSPKPQNPSLDIPILRRRDGLTKIRISSGRVESKSTETRLITIYDCRKVEGFDGKEWFTIWGN
jgi:hypothetical protein